jgi:hypothetical protein
LDGAIPVPVHSANSYTIPTTGYMYEYKFWLGGKIHHFELPKVGILPLMKFDATDVFGCGLILDPEDKLSIFFTVNGQLLGELVLEGFEDW